MSAKPGEPTGTGGGDGEATGTSEGGTTVALQKKRLRRVSFAENTSVRFFDRDDDENETPQPLEESDSKVGNDNDSEEIIELLGFRQLVESRGDGEEGREDEDRESDDEERVDMRRSFLRPVESPSSESGFGSATSNDENFFGPVSASFIRPDRLSDSGASDVNHDVTMDSTAFSMHFQSLARSDSGIDLKTPTGSRLSFEEKTSTQTNVGSSMEITMPNKLISQSSSPIVNEGCSSRSSSDMSLVGGSPASYDYGRLSPGLDALLAEGSKNLNVISDSDIDVASRSRRNSGSKFFPETENGGVFMNVTKNGKAVSKGGGEANSGLPVSPVAHAKLALGILTDKTNFSSDQSIKERTFRSVTYDKLGQVDGHIQNESPLTDFISSPAKRREALTICASPLKSMPSLTPQEERDPFRGIEIIKHDSASSIQKSISKLKLLEASPFSSSLRAENRNIKSRNISDSYPFDILSEKEMNNFQMKEFNASSTDTASQLSSDFQGKGAQVSNFNIENNHIEDSSGGNMPQTEECNVAAVSPSQLISPRKKMKHDLFRSKDSNDDVLVTAGIDFSSAETTLDYIREKNLTGTPQISVPFPDKGVEKKFTALPELQKPSKDLVLHDRFVKLKNFSPGRNLSLQGSAIDENLFTASLGRSDYLSIGREVHPSSPALEVSISNLNEVDSSVAKNGNNDSGNGGIGMTERSQFLHDREHDGNFQSGIDLSRSTSEKPRGEPEDASTIFSVPSIQKNLKELTLPKNLLDSSMQSPARKACQILARDNTCVHPVEDVLAPTSNQMKSPLKRRNRVIDFEGREHRNEVAVEERSPKLLKVGCQDVVMLGCTSDNFGERSVAAQASKHWTDIYSKFSHDAERLFTHSMDKLNLSVIDLLEGFLFQLKKLKMYEMVGTEIFAQKTCVHPDLRTGRAGGTRMLLHQILHGRAKLQLMRARQQTLLGKLQKLSWGNQESQMLKLNFLPKLRSSAQTDFRGLQNFLHMKQRDAVTCDKVAIIKQALEALDAKKAKFTKALQRSCKIKGELSCVDSISLVNDHLVKKSRYRLVRRDIQMWVVDDVHSRSGHHDIALNYLDLIIQRVKLTAGATSSVVISNKVDNAKIRKIFPNMDACKAFSVVLNAESTRKYFGCRSLAQETQVTSSLLGNLVDVVQELQMAQIELRNLTEISFHCPLVGQLNLHLSFFSFKSGKKVSLILDMSSLNWGIYPSDILPSQLTAMNGTNNASGDPIIGEIRDAFRSLRTGYMRIIRLCRCISLVVQGSSK